MSEKRTNIQEALVRQFNSGWNMLEIAINKVSDELLRKFKNEWGFVRTVIHIIETGEFYNSDSPTGFEWGIFANIDWENDSKEEVTEKYSTIKKIDIRNYLNLIKHSIENKITILSYDQILDSDGFIEYIPSIFDKYLYLLRQNMHHIGELNKTLRDNKEKRINWN